MILKNINDIPLKEVETAEKTYIKWLIGPNDGSKKIGLRKFILKAGGHIPIHRHSKVFHIQLVIKGKFLLGVEENVLRVKPGDIIYIAPKETHWYKNDTEEDAEFLCIIPLNVGYKTEYLEKVRKKASKKREKSKK